MLYDPFYINLWKKPSDLYYSNYSGHLGMKGGGKRQGRQRVQVNFEGRMVATRTFVMLSVTMISQVYTYVTIYHIVRFKYVYFSMCQLYLYKAVFKKDHAS